MKNLLFRPHVRRDPALIALFDETHSTTTGHYLLSMAEEHKLPIVRGKVAQGVGAHFLYYTDGKKPKIILGDEAVLPKSSDMLVHELEHYKQHLSGAFSEQRYQRKTLSLYFHNVLYECDAYAWGGLHKFELAGQQALRDSKTYALLADRVGGVFVCLYNDTSFLNDYYVAPDKVANTHGRQNDFLYDGMLGIGLVNSVLTASMAGNDALDGRFGLAAFMGVVSVASVYSTKKLFNIMCEKGRRAETAPDDGVQESLDMLAQWAILPDGKTSYLPYVRQTLDLSLAGFKASLSQEQLNAVAVADARLMHNSAVGRGLLAAERRAKALVAPKMV